MHLDRLPWVFCHHSYVFVKHKLDQISIVPNRERICLIFAEKTWIPSTVASIFQNSWSQEPTNAGMIQVCLFFFLTSADVSCPGLRMNRTSWRERNSSISVWCAPFATSGGLWDHTSRRSTTPEDAPESAGSHQIVSIWCYSNWWRSVFTGVCPRNCRGDTLGFWPQFWAIARRLQPEGRCWCAML